eukprot:scaffold509_cov22-Prasinocladus_malaysianus.AAC.1
MLLWAQQHDPFARHVKLWLPELAPLPPEIALEPWRLLVRDLSPLFTEPWACTACTYQNAADCGNCEMLVKMASRGHSSLTCKPMLTVTCHITSTLQVYSTAKLIA